MASHGSCPPSAPTATWDEPQYTGTGFPSDYYINYHLYRLTFPIMALGRCLAMDLADDGARAGIFVGHSNGTERAG